MNDYTIFPLAVFKKTAFSGLLLLSLFFSSNAQISITQCPADIVVDPPEGECGYTVNFDALQWSATGSYNNVEFSPGEENNPFPPGTTKVTLTVSNDNGSSDNCSFDVTVSPFSSEVFCRPDDVVITFDNECKRKLSHFDVLIGGPYGCDDLYEVQILDLDGKALGNEIDTGFVDQYFQVKVTNDQGSACWGAILVLSEGMPAKIVCPANANIDCHALSKASELPVIEGCFSPDSYEYSFVDDLIPSYCDGDNIAFTINRKWTVTLPNGDKLNCNQKITGHRIGLNEIVFPEDLDGIDKPALECIDTFNIDIDASPDVTGRPLADGLNPAGVACNMTLMYKDSLVNICGNQYNIYRKWTAFDFCIDEKKTHTQLIKVVDNKGPVFSVPDTILFGKHANCGNSILLPDINLIDECSAYTLKVETPWNTFNSANVMAPVASDLGLHDVVYTATDVCGNKTQETMVLHVSDKLLGQCPDRKKISSDYYLSTLKPALDANDVSVFNVFGEVQYFDNCTIVPEQDISVTLDDCYQGVLFRLITAEFNGTEHNCIQPIEVVHVSDFVVKFPADIEIVCGDTVPNVGEPKIFFETCELIAVAYEDEISTAVSGFCFQLERQWTVVNWCVAGEMADQEVQEMSEAQLSSSGCLPFSNNASCDLDGDGQCDERTFRDSWRACNLPNSGDAESALGPDTDPDLNPWDGFITYRQIIKGTDTRDPIFVNGCVPVQVCAHETDCSAGIIVPTPDIQDCSFAPKIETSVFINGAWANGSGPYSLAIGQYQVRYKVTDNCNNQTTCESIISVVDCTPPVAACLPEIEVELSLPAPPNFAVEAILNAFELDDGSLDNCTGNLKYSFSQATSFNKITYGCSGLGEHNLEVWITDEAGNQSKCKTTVTVLDNAFGDCAGAVLGITGTVFNEDGTGISGVSLKSSISSTVQTDNDGFYDLPNPNGVYPFFLIPQKNNNPSNGVTTFDIVLLTRHILGIETLDTPYKLIAADANRSNSITTFDAVEVRKLILGVNSTFPSNTSWRFVRQDHIFSNPTNPFAAPLRDTFWVNDQNTVNLDIIGIKIGDLNGSASPNFNEKLEDRNDLPTEYLLIENQHVSQNDKIEIPVYHESEHLIGFQCGLRFDTDHLALKEIKLGILSDGHFGADNLDKGELNVSYNQLAPFVSDKDSPLFTLVYEAKSDGEIMDWIGFAEGFIVPEAYTENLQQHKLSLLFHKTGVPTESSYVYPAYPNPFSDKTTLPFYLHKEQTVEIQLFTPTGQQLKQITKRFPAGHSSIDILASEVMNSTIIYYKCEIGSELFNGRMMIIK